MQSMNRNKILVSYFIERGKFSKSNWQRSMWACEDSPKYEINQIQARLRSLHGKDAKISITNVEKEKYIPNNPFS